jgi:hypothetical protein
MLFLPPLVRIQVAAAVVVVRRVRVTDIDQPAAWQRTR